MHEQDITDMQVDNTEISLDLESFPQIFDNALMVEFYKKRFPCALPPDVQMVCALCMNDKVTTSFSTMEEIICQGEACQQVRGGGARTCLCEQCADENNLRMEVAMKRKSGIFPKRSYFCQCPNESLVYVRKSIVMKGYAEDADSVYPLYNETQMAYRIDGSILFTEKPSIEQLHKDPELFKQHVLSSFLVQNGEKVVKTTFNTKPEASYPLYGKDKPMSVTFMLDKRKQALRLVVGMPATNVMVSKNNTTRGGSGSSSAGVTIDTSDNNDSGILSFLIDLPPNEDVQLLAEGVLDKSDSHLIFKMLKEGQHSALPSFCPIPELNIMTAIDVMPATNCPSGAAEPKILTRLEASRLEVKLAEEAFFIGLCTESGYKYTENKDTQKYSVIVNTGTELCFENIEFSSRILGFGCQARCWDWHIVFLRAGNTASQTTFITLYVLVSHAPTAGVWVIKQTEYIVDDLDDCKSYSMMFGRDLGPYQMVSHDGYTLSKYIWPMEKMPVFGGHSEYSNALLRCITTVPESYGPFMSELFRQNLLTVSQVKASFEVHNKNEIEKDRKGNYVMLAKAKVVKNSSPATYIVPCKRNPLIVGASAYAAVEVPVFKRAFKGLGLLTFSATEHSDKDDEEGQIIPQIHFSEKENMVTILAHSGHLIYIKLSREVDTSFELGPEGPSCNIACKLIYTDASLNFEESESQDFTWGNEMWTFDFGVLEMHAKEEDNYYIFKRTSDNAKIFEVCLKVIV